MLWSPPAWITAVHSSWSFPWRYDMEKMLHWICKWNRWYHNNWKRCTSDRPKEWLPWFSYIEFTKKDLKFWRMLWKRTKKKLIEKRLQDLFEVIKKLSLLKVKKKNCKIGVFDLKVKINTGGPWPIVHLMRAQSYNNFWKSDLWLVFALMTMWPCGHMIVIWALGNWLTLMTRCSILQSSQPGKNEEKKWQLGKLDSLNHTLHLRTLWFV